MFIYIDTAFSAPGESKLSWALERKETSRIYRSKAICIELGTLSHRQDV